MSRSTTNKYQKINGVGGVVKKMTTGDKVFIAVFVSVVILVFIASYFSFEMITENRSGTYKLVMLVVAFLVNTYFLMKYFGPKKITTYVNLVLITAVVTVLLLLTCNKAELLYHLLISKTTHTEIDVKAVKKYLVKGSLSGSRVLLVYDHKTIEFQSSSSNYFALKGKKKIAVWIGRAGSDNYYITKIDWQDGEKIGATLDVWKYNFHRFWIVPLIFIIFFLYLFLSIRYPRLSTFLKPKQNFFTRLSPWLQMLVFIATLFVIGLLFLLGVFFYNKFL